MMARFGFRLMIVKCLTCGFCLMRSVAVLLLLHQIFGKNDIPAKTEKRLAMSMNMFSCMQRIGTSSNRREIVYLSMRKADEFIRTQTKIHEVPGVLSQ